SLSLLLCRTPSRWYTKQVDRVQWSQRTEFRLRCQPSCANNPYFPTRAGPPHLFHQLSPDDEAIKIPFQKTTSETSASSRDNTTAIATTRRYFAYSNLVLPSICF